jgi:hypothetical protein
MTETLYHEACLPPLYLSIYLSLSLSLSLTWEEALARAAEQSACRFQVRRILLCVRLVADR